MASKFYGRHHELVDRYEISIYQMIIDLFPFKRYINSSMSDNPFIKSDVFNILVNRGACVVHFMFLVPCCNICYVF
jgi:hypothetical protein